MKPLIPFLFLLVFSLDQAFAVQNGGGYNSTEPTTMDVPNWNTGWGASGVTGWDYVGSVNNASGVYLGNGWVLTAGHVGAGTFTLQGTAYQAVNGSARSFSDSNGTADLTMFQIVSGPDLPQLIVTDTAPTSFSETQAGTQVVIIGYGGGQGETWGLNTVTSDTLMVTVKGYSFVTIDFETAYGTTTAGQSSVTNQARLVLGDSGGGGFVYDAVTGHWLLAGINEAVDGSSNSYLVQLSRYASQIKQSESSIPEPQTWALVGLGLTALLIQRNKQRANIFRP